MKKLTTVLAMLLSIICGTQAYGQNSRQEFTDSLIKDQNIIMFGSQRNASADSIRALVESFYYDQFRHFQDPAAPYFMFMSRDANLAMGIGGMVRIRGYYDWGGSVNNPAFTPYYIPTSNDPLHERLLGTTPSGTCLFFRIIGRNKRLASYQLYIQANFQGYGSRDFHLKKAYAIINDWTIGYASSTFGDDAAMPPVIDSGGPTMKMSNTNVLVRYMHGFRNGIVVAGSVETPSMNVQEDANGSTAARSLFLPNVAAFVQYQWSNNEHVRLAAIGRSLPYRDMLTGTNRNPLGWGLQLSSVFSPVRPLTIYATVNGGRSYSNYGGDYMLGKYDLIADPEHQGRLETVPGFGYILGVQYNFTPGLYVCTAFSQGRNLTPTAKAEGGDYKYGLSSQTNVVWNLTPRIQAGAEFSIGKRQNFDGTHGWSHRLGLMAGFSF